MVDAVAGVLRNTRAVCRKSYIHPGIIDACQWGGFARACDALRADPPFVEGTLSGRMCSARDPAVVTETAETKGRLTRQALRFG